MLHRGETDRTAWIELSGQPDAPRFFRSLLDLFPGASTIFIEVGGPDDEVSAIYRSHAEEGPYLPGRQTLWPKARTFRLEFSAATLGSLSILAARRATPEFADHLSVFEGGEALLHYPDAFAPDAVVYVSASVPIRRLRDWATPLGLQVKDPDLG